MKKKEIVQSDIAKAEKITGTVIPPHEPCRGTEQ